MDGVRTMIKSIFSLLFTISLLLTTNLLLITQDLLAKPTKIQKRKQKQSKKTKLKRRPIKRVRLVPGLKLNYFKPVVAPPNRIMITLPQAIAVREIVVFYPGPEIDEDEEATRFKLIRKLSNVFKKTSSKSNKLKILEKLVPLLEQNVSSVFARMGVDRKASINAATQLYYFLGRKYSLIPKKTGAASLLYQLTLFSFYLKKDVKAINYATLLRRNFARSEYAFRVKIPLYAYYAQNYQKNSREIRNLRLVIGGLEPEYQRVFSLWGPGSPILNKHLKALPNLYRNNLEGIYSYVLEDVIDKRITKQAIVNNNSQFPRWYFLKTGHIRDQRYNYVLERVAINLCKKGKKRFASKLFVELEGRVASEDIAPGIYYKAISCMSGESRAVLIKAYKHLMKTYNMDSPWFTSESKIKSIVRIKQDVYKYFDSLKHNRKKFTDYITSFVAFLKYYGNLTNNPTKELVYKNFADYYVEVKKHESAAYFYLQAKKFAAPKQVFSYHLKAIKNMEVLLGFDKFKPQMIKEEDLIPLDEKRNVLVKLYDELIQRWPRYRTVNWSQTLSGIIFLQSGEAQQSFRRIEPIVRKKLFPRFTTRIAPIIIKRLRKNEQWKYLYILTADVLRNKAALYKYPYSQVVYNHDLAELRLIEMKMTKWPLAKQISSIESFIQKKPKTPVMDIAQELLGDKCIEYKDYFKGLKAYKTLLGFLPKGRDKRMERINMIAGLYENLFLFPQAADYYELLWSESEGAKEGIYTAARIREGQLKYQKASENYKFYLKTVTDKDEARNMQIKIADLQGKLGKPLRSRAIFQRLLKVYTGNELETARILLEAGRYYRKYQLFERADKNYKKITKFDPASLKKNSEILAEAYYYLGEKHFNSFKSSLGALIHSKKAQRKFVKTMQSMVDLYLKAAMFGKKGKFAILANIALYKMHYAVYLAYEKRKVDKEPFEAVEYKRRAKFYIRKANALMGEAIIPSNDFLDLQSATAIVNDSNAMDLLLIPADRFYITNELSQFSQ